MIGYLGPEKSFTYFAASTFYVKSELVSYNSIQRLFEALIKDDVIGIVVPLEDGIEETTSDILEKLLNVELHINREIVMDISLSLISKNSDISKIKYIISNNFAFEESRNVLQKQKVKYKEVYASSTSIALKELEKHDDSYAAIASRNEIYGNLVVLINNVREKPYHFTRFVFITKALEIIGFHNKTSIVLSTNQNKPGALYDILHEFAIRNIELTRIVSKLKKGSNDEYLFYLDFYGNIEETSIKEALEMLKHKTSYFKILGSYYSKKK